MRFLFTLITILFFSFNNANASIEKDIIMKGEVIAYFFEDGGRSNTKTIILRYADEICECKIFADNFSCKTLTVFL